MAKDPGIGKEMIATIKDVKGDCSATGRGIPLRSVVMIPESYAAFSIMIFFPAFPPSNSAGISPGGKATRSSYNARTTITS